MRIKLLFCQRSGRWGHLCLTRRSDRQGCCEQGCLTELGSSLLKTCTRWRAAEDRPGGGGSQTGYSCW